jgi:protocatechuate 3,4-dioxygenase beta subunit
MSIPSPYCTIGPYFPTEFSTGLDDLTHHQGHTAQGSHILLTGTVVEEGGKPTFNTIVEIWQPDAHGKFNHDPGFYGWGRSRTGRDGRYSFRTVFPGSYEEAGALRLPHINLMILAIGVTRRMVTTIFFSQGADPVLDCVPHAHRQHLIALRDPSRDENGVPAYVFNIVLRGEGETPFFLD